MNERVSVAIFDHLHRVHGECRHPEAGGPEPWMKEWCQEHTHRWIPEHGTCMYMEKKFSEAENLMRAVGPVVEEIGREAEKTNADLVLTMWEAQYARDRIRRRSRIESAVEGLETWTVTTTIEGRKLDILTVELERIIEIIRRES